jgi:hypothetical protein
MMEYEEREEMRDGRLQVKREEWWEEDEERVSSSV